MSQMIFAAACVAALPCSSERGDCQLWCHTGLAAPAPAAAAMRGLCLAALAAGTSELCPAGVAVRTDRDDNGYGPSDEGLGKGPPEPLLRAARGHDGAAAIRLLGERAGPYGASSF